MKTTCKVSAMIISVIALTLSFSESINVFAATAPTLWAASSYSAFWKAGVTNDSNVGTTHVWGNVGADGTNVVNLDDAIQVDGVINDGAGVEAAILTAYGQLTAEPGVPVVLNLAWNNTVSPGIYDVGATTLNGILTLSGTGVYIFRSSSSIVVAAWVGAEVKLTNWADACNVFWQIPASMTIGAGAKMVWTIIASTELISLGTNATLQGRALSRIAQVTLLSNQITEPTCNPIPPIPPVPPVPPTPPVSSGGGGSWAWSEAKIDSCPDGDYSYSYYDDICGTPPTVIDRIIPLIGILKVPTPLALPAGSGSVTYNYLVWNVGWEQALKNITVTDNKCSTVSFLSGDLNNNKKLDVTENWKYSCTSTLLKTTTNTAIASGYSDDAYNQIAVATAVATVVVWVPLTPPLISITKVPSRLTPFKFGGGDVTYTYTVRNPGIVAIKDVVVTDDKCAPVFGPTGDVNKNKILETTETWKYTCDTNILVSTRNTATVKGNANGFTATAHASASVIVLTPVSSSISTPKVEPKVIPGLPNTWTTTEKSGIPWNIIILVNILLLASISIIITLRNRSI